MSVHVTLPVFEKIEAVTAIGHVTVIHGHHGLMDPIGFGVLFETADVKMVVT